MLDEEAQVTAELWHPNVISVFDYDHDPTGAPFLVMDTSMGSISRRSSRWGRFRTPR
jgi:hypothetical protein